MTRPSTYTEEVARAICDRLAQTGSLRRVCAAADMPHDNTVRRWLAVGKFTLDGEPFSQVYARAKEAGIDALVDETLDISDDGSNDWLEREHGPQVNGEAIARSKLRAETRRWLAERMAPRKYGLRTATELSGPDGGPVKTQVVIATGVPTEINAEDLV